MSPKKDRHGLQTITALVRDSKSAFQLFRNLDVALAYHPVLIVGDGDFSYARAFSELARFPFKLVATSLDSEENLNQSYLFARKHLDSLRHSRVTIRHQVNATRIKEGFLIQNAKSFWGGNFYARTIDRFSVIVWNFPSKSKHTRGEQIKNRHLLESFLRNCETNLLQRGGVVCLTVLSHQGQHESWQLDGPPGNRASDGKTVKNAGMTIIGRVPFQCSEFETYEPNFDANKWEATTYVLQAANFARQSSWECPLPVCFDALKAVEEVANEHIAMYRVLKRTKDPNPPIQFPRVELADEFCFRHRP
jgi:hypothetical protein